jgi:transposase
MYKILTVEKRDSLVLRLKTERDRKVAYRINVVLLSDEGWTSPKIARALFLGEDAVRDYLEIYQEEERLSFNHKGSKPLLTQEESKILSDHLESQIYVKIKDIQAYVREAFKKELSISTLHLWLQKNNFSYKKPKLIPKGADVEAQKAFIADYEALMNEAAIEGDPVLFGDSVHPSQQTRPAYGWIKKGQDKEIETTGARKRVNLMGALNLECMSFFYQDFETINSQATIEFFKKLEGAYPHARKIHWILDNAGYFTSDEVTKYLETSRIKVHYLPPRCPNLNPIERLWKIMHEHVSNNKVYGKFKDFKAALFGFFDTSLPNITEILVSRITDNFHLINPAK